MIIFSLINSIIPLGIHLFVIKLPLGLHSYFTLILYNKFDIYLHSANVCTESEVLSTEGFSSLGRDECELSVHTPMNQDKASSGYHRY